MPRRRSGGERGEITVWPRAMSDEIGSIPPPASGLSIDTEDLGAQFLSNATEQTRSEWPGEPDTGDYSVEDGLAVIGDGFDEAGYERDPRGWERAITRSLRAGKLRALSAKAREDEQNGPEELAEHAWDELDLTDESIQEASLLDHEAEELGEVESPFLRTDDTHTHGRPRGGHVPGGKRKRARL